MIWIILVLAIPSAWVLTRRVRSYGLATRLLDHPNERSSHSVPTPRGGGLSIVLTTLAGTLILHACGLMDSHLALATTIGGAAVAFVGFMDDRGSVSVRVRLLVHVAAAIWGLYVMRGLPDIRIGTAIIHPGVYGYPFGVMAVVWSLNLFNFMDGIDGIAASEAIFIGAAGALMASSNGTFGSAAVLGGLVAAASLGFLLWNWPPARIFMGDVGSGYLGYILAMAALGAAGENAISAYQWSILGGVFLTDATVTLLRRFARGEKVYSAHRTHAYQWLARRWHSHLRVTLLVWIINVGWLLPLAYLAGRTPSTAWLVTLIALVPLAALALVAGAGRAETNV
jgi:Fuc2NAc and GlcNAc transferase